MTIKQLKAHQQKVDQLRKKFMARFGHLPPVEQGVEWKRFRLHHLKTNNNSLN